ncbi:RimK family alpha-L-glutamate ligase [Nocardioides sp. MH1]|uniref:ATP-grasp domain-containing protein n=1 Tax=Nocardioides sp. MH1 TaxID=3242490 RepID=UPI00352212CA
MPLVLLVTFALMPSGEPGGEVLVPALAERGIDARWVCWDDRTVDWAAADLVAVRSAWDYHRRLPAFLDWARSVEAGTRLLNGADVFAWNADKSYLVELAAHVPVVPTAVVEDAALVPGLSAALQRWGTVVIKPCTGAGGRGVVVVRGIGDGSLFDLAPGPWVVQPLVTSVRTSGETSVYVLGGRAVSQVDKAVAGEEIRVHEQYGGISRPVPLDPSLAEVAERAVAAAAGLCAADLPYARVDLMSWQGKSVVSELELIEPGLYLDVDPTIAEPFADAVAAVVGRPTHPPGALGATNSGGPPTSGPPACVDGV